MIRRWTIGPRVALIWALLLPHPMPCHAQQRGPSPAFRAELQKTLEKRRQRRARRGDGFAPNSIVPWMMPPSLIIRATPEVHDEVNSLLRTLRKGP